MALEWPDLGRDLLLSVQKHFRTPLHFDAAFDDDLSASELLQSIFPDLVAEDVMDLVATLMVWKESSGRSLKRARLETVQHVMYLPLHSPADSVQTVFKRLTQSNALSLIEAHSKRRQKILKMEADTRGKRLDAERKKYSLLLAQVIIDAQLPCCRIDSDFGQSRTRVASFVWDSEMQHSQKQVQSLAAVCSLVRTSLWSKVSHSFEGHY